MLAIDGQLAPIRAADTLVSYALERMTGGSTPLTPRRAPTFEASSFVLTSPRRSYKRRRRGVSPAQVRAPRTTLERTPR